MVIGVGVVGDAFLSPAYLLSEDRLFGTPLFHDYRPAVSGILLPAGDHRCSGGMDHEPAVGEQRLLPSLFATQVPGAAGAGDGDPGIAGMSANMSSGSSDAIAAVSIMLRDLYTP